MAIVGITNCHTRHQHSVVSGVYHQQDQGSGEVADSAPGYGVSASQSGVDLG